MPPFCDLVITGGGVRPGSPPAIDIFAAGNEKYVLIRPDVTAAAAYPVERYRENIIK